MAPAIHIKLTLGIRDFKHWSVQCSPSVNSGAEHIFKELLLQAVEEENLSGKVSRQEKESLDSLKKKRNNLSTFTLISDAVYFI